jgi:DedD protein
MEAYGTAFAVQKERKGAFTMKKKIMTTLFLGVLASLMLLMTGGCGRKHIVSSPPTPKATKSVKAEPTTKAKKAQKKPGLIEETYTVDAPKESAPAPIIKESELKDEPVVAPVVQDKADGAVKATSQAAVEQPADKQATPLAPEAKKALQDEVYYVQVGAFSDLENANRALARLLSDGYEGSKLSKTEDGLFRVQAGTFSDKVLAGEALSKLLADYPKGFILTEPLKK